MWRVCERLFAVAALVISCWFTAAAVGWIVAPPVETQLFAMSLGCWAAAGWMLKNASEGKAGQ